MWAAGPAPMARCQSGSGPMTKSVSRAPLATDPHLGIPPGYYDRVFRRGRGVQWFWHRERFRKVEQAIPREATKVLDLGCGPGTFLGQTERRFAAALGVDLAPSQIEYARRHYDRQGLEFQVGDVGHFESTQRFDAVVSIEVIEHLPPADTGRFLGNILQLLRPGGWAVLTTPNYRSLWPLLEQAVSRLGPVDYRAQHINRFTEQRLQEELASAGFRDVGCETFFVVAPFLAAVSTGLAGSMLGIEARLLPRLGSEILACARRPPA